MSLPRYVVLLHLLLYVISYISVCTCVHQGVNKTCVCSYLSYDLPLQHHTLTLMSSLCNSLRIKTCVL